MRPPLSNQTTIKLEAKMNYEPKFDPALHITAGEVKSLKGTALDLRDVSKSGMPGMTAQGYDYEIAEHVSDQAYIDGTYPKRPKVLARSFDAWSDEPTKMGHSPSCRVVFDRAKVEALVQDEHRRIREEMEGGEKWPWVVIQRQEFYGPYCTCTEVSTGNCQKRFAFDEAVALVENRRGGTYYLEHGETQRPAMYILLHKIWEARGNRKGYKLARWVRKNAIREWACV
jgi:hypothetical protein